MLSQLLAQVLHVDRSLGAPFFYTILLPDGRERQTERDRLSLVAPPEPSVPIRRNKLPQTCCARPARSRSRRRDKVYPARSTVATPPARSSSRKRGRQLERSYQQSGAQGPKDSDEGEEGERHAAAAAAEEHQRREEAEAAAMAEAEAEAERKQQFELAAAYEPLTAAASMTS